jgi:DNA invertase Pin-like site-specific DNA recombinase
MNRRVHEDPNDAFTFALDSATRSSTVAKIPRGEKFTRNTGIVRGRLGRPEAEPDQLEQVRRLLAQGKRIVNTPKACALDVSTRNGRRAVKRSN